MANVFPFIASIRDLPRQSLDPCTSRLVELTNGMRIQLLSDPDCELAMCSLSVRVGYMADPNHLQGLAHLLEHVMCNGGNAKYREESEFIQFVSKHGGQRNANTGSKHTNYHFDISADHLPGALDRFAHMMLQPTLTTDLIDREIEAVHSEYVLRKTYHNIRINNILRSTRNPDHPASKCSTGNRSTLRSIPLPDLKPALENFYSLYYSANLVSMAVMGKETLDELTRMVVSQFGVAVSKNALVPAPPNVPLTKYSNLQINIVANKPVKELMLDLHVDANMSYKVTRYLVYFLEHPGPGSLWSELKLQNWATTVSVIQTAGTLTVQFKLTLNGLQHTNNIILLFFKYINMLREEGVQDRLLRQLDDMENIYNRKGDLYSLKYVSELADKLHAAPSQASQADYQCLQQAIEKLLQSITPRAMTVLLISETFEKTQWHEESLGIPYSHSLHYISDSVLQDWENAGRNEHFHLPADDISGYELPPNSHHQTDASTTPVLLQTVENNYVYHQSDYKVTSLYFTMWLSHQAFDDGSAANALMLTVLQESLMELEYPARLAGICCTMFPALRGQLFSVYVTAPSTPALILFLTRLMHSFQHISLSAHRFQSLLDQRAADNQCPSSCPCKLYASQTNISLDSFTQYHKQFSTQCKSVILVHGGSQNDALCLSDIVQRKILANQPPKSEDKQYSNQLGTAPSKTEIKQYGNQLGTAPSKTENKQYGNQLGTASLKTENKQYGNQLGTAPSKTENKQYGNQLGTAPSKTENKQYSNQLGIAPPKTQNKQYGNQLGTAKEVFNMMSYDSIAVYFDCMSEQVHEQLLILLVQRMIHAQCFISLRTKQQLGYIASCQVTYPPDVKLNNHIDLGYKLGVHPTGLKIIIGPLVEKNFDEVAHCVDEFVEQASKYLQAMTEDDFNAHVASLALCISKRENLQNETYIAWCKVVFRTQCHRESMIRNLKELTQSDVCNFFKQHFTKTAPQLQKRVQYHYSNNTQDAFQ